MVSEEPKVKDGQRFSQRHRRLNCSGYLRGRSEIGKMEGIMPAGRPGRKEKIYLGIDIKRFYRKYHTL